MKKIFLAFMINCLVLSICHQRAVQAGDFVLLESYPSDGQTVTASDLHNNGISLKFNNPIDRNRAGYVRIHYVSDGFICQMNICGKVDYAENDTKIIWHPNTSFDTNFKPGKYFEIELDQYSLLRDISGNKLPITRISFNIDTCKPTIRLNISRNSSFYDCGDTITVQVHLINPTCGSKLEIEGKVWLELPDKKMISLTDPPAIFILYPNDEFLFNLLSYSFSGKEPFGWYKIGARLINPLNGNYYDKDIVSFEFKPDKCH